MRTVLLVSVTLLVLAGVFGAYLLMQGGAPAPVAGGERELPLPARPRDVNRPTPATTPAAGGLTTGGAAQSTPAAVAPPTTQPLAAERVIGAGENVWVKNVDKSGRLANEFRAARYDPRPDDTVDVLKPEARFYVDEDSILILTAERGRIFVPPATGQREAIRDTRGQMPTRGELIHVTLALHRSVDAPAVLSANMPNIVFDNDTFRIATESYTDATGATVPADAVPVTVRGEEYDFDGYGLVLRWNEMDGRLQALDIARGERLVVKRPEALKLGDVSAADPGGERPQHDRPPLVVRWNGPVRVAPVSVNRTLLRETYRMRLGDRVRITQAEQPLADADQLDVSFTLDRRQQREQEARGQKPDQPPILVSLGGAPAVVRLQGMEARAAIVSYDSSTGSATLRGSPEQPHVAMQDTSGRTIFAQRVEFDGASNIATLAGPVKFELPLEARADRNAGEPPRLILAEARRQCRLTFEKGQSSLAVKSAEFEGDVVIDHPQLRLEAQSLTLGFAPSTADPQTGTTPDLSLSGLSASGGVRARVLDDHRQAQTIECATLELATAEDSAGTLVARELKAGGGVRIDAPGQQLSAGAVEATFRPVDPARRPSAGASPQLLSAGPGREVATLLATDGVKVRSADGTSIDADRVVLAETERRRWLTLTGAPATLGDGQGKLSAERLRFDPDTGDAIVSGGGQFDAILATTDPGDAAPDRPARPPQPATVRWQKELAFRAADNRAEAEGGVEILARQPDGTAVRGTADRLLLVVKPAAQPTEPDATPRGAPLAGRTLESASLLGDVQLTALRHDEAGQPVQRVHLFGSRLDYRPAEQTFAIASNGRMLVEDRRPLEPARPADESPTGVSARGATAFQWGEKLTFASASNRAEMTGEVLVVHRPGDATDDQRDIRLQADAVAAEITAAADAAASPSGDPATQVRKVVATGNVRVDSSDFEFLADEVEFRPLDDILIARGTDRAPAVLLDDQGLSRGSFVEMWLNTRTQESHLKDFRATVRR